MDEALLTRLIDWAERILVRGASPNDDFAALGVALDESGTGDESAMLLMALHHAAAERHSALRPWSMIAGALLPMVKGALGRAIEQRRVEQQSETADHEQRGGRAR